jgi:hypothetical protein
MPQFFVFFRLIAPGAKERLPKRNRKKGELLFAPDTGLSPGHLYFESVSVYMQQLEKFLIRSAANLLAVTLIGLLGRPPCNARPA